MLKGKSYTRTYAESILGHALVLWLKVLNSSFCCFISSTFLPFFLLFLFSSLFFCFSFFSLPFSFSLSSYYILWFFFLPFPPSTCGSSVGSPFSLLPLPFLEPSILSCKAACSLFRHHLHINAARELAGQHLMRGQQYSQIFVFSNSYPLSDIFSSTLLQDLSETLS